MEVICSGYKKCNDNCSHRVPHIHNEAGWADCDGECCVAKPYHCTQEALILYNRKFKLEKINGSRR